MVCVVLCCKIVIVRLGNDLLTLLSAASALTINLTVVNAVSLTVRDLLLFLLLFILVLVALVSRRWDPEARLAVLEWRILSGEVVTLGGALNIVAATLREVSSTGGKLGADSSVGADPVGEGILAVLDDSLGGLVTIVGIAGLTWGDWGVVDELEEVLSEAGNDGQLLAVLAKGIELVSVGSLELLTGDVGKLCLGDKRLSFSTDKLLLKDHDTWGVWLLVLELGNLVGDLLLACTEY